MNEVKINWKGNVDKYQNAMEELNLDFCVLTRLKSLTYLHGCFVPWRSAIFLPAKEQGNQSYIQFFWMLHVVQRRDN